MLVLYFCCRCCRTALRLPYCGVRPAVACPKCKAVFRMPKYGCVRLGFKKAESKSRAEMFWSVQGN